MASAPDDGAPTPPSAVPAPSPVADVPDPSPPPAASRVPDGTGAFVQDALRRCGMRWDRVVVHLDRAIVQANATVVPVTTHDKVLTTKDRHGVTVPRDVPAIIGTRHLVVKFVHILETTFRDDEHRERTRASYACECAFYRARQRAPGSRGADAGQWATPFTYLVEGDAQSDTFVIVMDDVSKLKPGVAERARARARKNAEARAVENDVRGDIDEGDDEDGATADGDGATADEDGATADAAAGTTTPPMGASFERASAALEWLASFHAHWWRDLPDAPPRPRSCGRGADTGPWRSASRTWTVWRRSGRNCSRRSTTMRRSRRTEPSRRVFARRRRRWRERARAARLARPPTPAAAERWCTATLSSPTSSFRPSPRCATRRWTLPARRRTWSTTVDVVVALSPPRPTPR